MNIFYKQWIRGVLQKKLFLKFHKIYSKKPVPVACNFIEKETLLQVFEFCETFKDTFLIEHLMSSACIWYQNFLLSV